MKKYIYLVLEKEKKIPCYGMEVQDEEKCCLRKILDITPNKLAMEALAALCNEKAADILHFEDIVEDFVQNDYKLYL